MDRLHHSHLGEDHRPAVLGGARKKGSPIAAIAETAVELPS